MCNTIPCVALCVWAADYFPPHHMLFLSTVLQYNKPNKSKHHPSIFVCCLLIVEWKFVFTLMNSGPAKTWPTRPFATALLSTGLLANGNSIICSYKLVSYNFLEINTSCHLYSTVQWYFSSLLDSWMMTVIVLEMPVPILLYTYNIENIKMIIGLQNGTQVMLQVILRLIFT